MARNTTHELQPRTDHDGESRRLSVLASKRAIRTVFEQRLREQFQQLDKDAGVDVSGAAGTLPAYPYWACANRAVQDRMWSLLAKQVDDDYSRISSQADSLKTSETGSLQLDGQARIPEYQHRQPIHGQPGGYMLERSADDLAAGVLYEAGGNIYAMGQGIGKRDSKGERLIGHIRQHHPDFRPARILEMGCSAGGQSTDYPVAFPDAEFHALDLSPAMLRYAHARARALGANVNFHQADAAHTPFDDASFDLVISHNMMHEVAAEHLPAIMLECHRLLKPGGVCIHQDVPVQPVRLDPFTQFLSDWQKDHNHEPFWLDFANADVPALMAAAGFERDAIRADYIRAIDGPIPWYVVSAIR